MAKKPQVWRPVTFYRELQDAARCAGGACDLAVSGATSRKWLRVTSGKRRKRIDYRTALNARDVTLGSGAKHQTAAAGEWQENAA